MSALMKNDPQAAMYANNYWAGETTERPVWELLVASATVVEEMYPADSTRGMKRRTTPVGKRLAIRSS